MNFAVIFESSIQASNKIIESIDQNSKPKNSTKFPNIFFTTYFPNFKMWFIWQSKPAVQEVKWWEYINSANAALLITTLISYYLVRRARKWLSERRAHVAVAEGENAVFQVRSTKSHHPQRLSTVNGNTRMEDTIPEETTDSETEIDEATTSVSPEKYTIARRATGY